MSGAPPSSEPGRDGYAFLHLSDIHFGQERGGDLFINNVIKDDLIGYVGDLAAKRNSTKLQPIDGILVTGDIAFSGVRSQYRDAAEWLALICEKLGCPQTAVRVVPGNHDVDRKRVTPGVRDMIDKIIDNGQKALDEFVENESDRERLYERFSEYRVFAAGYECDLDNEGGSAGTKDYVLRNGLRLRFLGLNSALVCRGGAEDNEPGKLFLGMKQRAIKREDGVEHVVLIHHPMNWLADQEESWGFLKTRARVFISGHEHKPNLVAEDIEGNGKILRVDSGAIVPPDETDSYGYTFNVIDFVLDPNDRDLHVSVQGHLWNSETTSFSEDSERFDDGHEKTEVLHCPMFERQQARYGMPEPARVEITGSSAPVDAAKDEEETMAPPAVDTKLSNASVLAELRLRYFHDLSPLQRLQVLIAMEILPTEFDGPMTATVELGALDALASMGRLEGLREAIEQYVGGVDHGSGE